MYRLSKSSMYIVLCARDYPRDYRISLHVAISILYTEEMSIVELFSRAKHLQQPAAAKVEEEIEVNYWSW